MQQWKTERVGMEEMFIEGENRRREERKAVPICSPEAATGLINWQALAKLITPFRGEPDSFCMSCHLFCVMQLGDSVTMDWIRNLHPGKGRGTLAREVCPAPARLVGPCSVLRSPPNQICSGGRLPFETE